MWPNFSYCGVKSVIKCTNLTHVPTTVDVAVVVDGFVVGKIWVFRLPWQSWLVSALALM